MNNITVEKNIQQQLQAGVDAHVRGNLLAAESAYLAALSLDVKNATAHNNLGFIYGQKGQWDSALEHLHAALHSKPDYATALSNIGQIYFSIGEREKAFEFLERAAVLDSKDPQNWHNLARLCLLVGNYQRAEYAWWRAHNLRADNLEYAVNLGISIAAQYRFSDAEKIYESVLARNPSHFTALLQLGICWLLMKNYGNAKKVFMRALQLNEKNPSLLRHLGLVELTLGNKSMAAEYFNALIELAPDDQETHVDYALILLELEDWAALKLQKDWLQSLDEPGERAKHYLPVITGALDTHAIH